MAASLSIFEAARLRLARLTTGGAADLERGFQQALAASARALGVARVGAWFFSPDGQSLQCGCHFELTSETFNSGAVLPLATFPAYRRALLSRRVVMATDAVTSEDTGELRDAYLNPNRITSMMDVPIYRHGEVVGVVCHEHVGPMREWTVRERDFACSVADLLAVLLEQATRIDMEAALRDQTSRLANLQRVEALARLGSGVAHDFNNVLFALSMSVEMLSQQYAHDPVLRAALAEITDISDRGKRIAQQLLTFSKAKPIAPRSMNLTRAISELRSMLAALTSGNHRLRLEVTSEVVAVHADPAQIDQLLLNLVVNARDAMPGGGTVHVSFDATPEFAVLTVSDEGAGIEPGVLERIFEPFFTTKGHGNGLGLSTVHSIVEQSGGSIEVKSQPGHGAAFIVRLPRIG